MWTRVSSLPAKVNRIQNSVYKESPVSPSGAGEATNEVFISALAVQKFFRGNLFYCCWISVKLEKSAFNNSACTSFNSRFADLFKHPFCNVVSVVLLGEIKEHVMHGCFQDAFLHQSSLMRDDPPTFSPHSLFSKQMCFKVKRSFCGDTKPRSVSCREQGDVINPSDRDTMHSSLQMVQTLNGVTLSLSGHQKIKAPCQNKPSFGTFEFLIFSLFIHKNGLFACFFYCLRTFQHASTGIQCCLRHPARALPLVHTL